MPRLTNGHPLPSQTLQSIRHEFIPIPPTQTPLLHLQFRRFAGCPICNLHLRSIAKRHDELRSAGIQEVAIFHSTAQTMLPFQGDLPFPVVADPEKKLYERFGVEQGVASVMDPRAWGGLLRGVVASHGAGMMTGEGGHLGLPADFLIDQKGVIVACKYGDHADDQWSVEELLELSKDAR